MSGAKIIEGLKEALELAREGKTMREPPKRWRNWWRAIQVHYTGDSMTTANRWRPGDIYPSEKQYPSKDVAETQAAKKLELRGSNGGLGAGFFEFVGAFPEGERP